MQTIRKGDLGRAVRVLQRLLGATPDGIYGAKTVSAVLAFQDKHGLVVDGICGAKTWAALAAAQDTIKAGNAGGDVAAVQELLGITVDGKFGSQTKLAVLAAQRADKLKEDGIVGQQTWKYLLTDYAPIPATVVAEPERPVDYKQFDSRWAKVMYSNHGDRNQTIKSSGCGPAAMADILATWIDPDITPVQTCASALEHGFRTRNSGTRREYFAWVSKQYPFAAFEQTTDTDKAIAALQGGALVVALMAPGYWTKGGHYICLWKYEPERDRIHACDPGSSTRKYASASSFRKERKAYFIFYR